MRSRITYVILAVLFILSGLAIRTLSISIPGVIKIYAPDVIWAMLVFTLAALIAPKLSGERLALYALAFAYATEFSQLYHAPSSDAVRTTKIGALLLGSTFVPSDLACYTIGIGGGYLMDRAILKKSRAPILER